MHRAVELVYPDNACAPERNAGIRFCRPYRDATRLVDCLSMIFSENRLPLFGIMLQMKRARPITWTRS
jgi:hypothetical protein